MFRYDMIAVTNLDPRCPFAVDTYSRNAKIRHRTLQSPFSELTRRVLGANKNGRPARSTGDQVPVQATECVDIGL